MAYSKGHDKEGCSSSGEQFDELAKTFARATSRRAALKALAGVALGGLAALVGGAAPRVKADDGDSTGSAGDPESDTARPQDGGDSAPDLTTASCGGPNQPCCPGHHCQPPLVCNAVSGATGVCCPEGSKAINGKCCPQARICGGTPTEPPICCPEGYLCVHGKCCPRDQVQQTADGLVCCPRGTSFINGACCPNAQVCGGTNGTPKICCPSGTTCINGQCCPNSQVQQTATGPVCCPEGSTVINGVCCPKAQVCMGPNGAAPVCCPTNATCVNGKCCPSNQIYQTPTGPVCCPAGTSYIDGKCQQCSGCVLDGKCYPMSDDYCGFGKICVACAPGTHCVGGHCV